MKPLFFVLIALGLICFSCEKTLEDDQLPKINPKLVVGCFLSPDDSLIILSLTQSDPIGTVKTYSGQPTIVRDASVILSSDHGSIHLTYNDSLLSYTADPSLFPILPGYEYRLQIHTPSGLSASSVCTIPNSSGINPELSIDSSIIHHHSGWTWTEKRLVLKVGWTDPSPEVNYYRLIGQVRSRSQLSTFQGHTQLIYFMPEQPVFNDGNKNGGYMGPYEGYGYLGSSDPEEATLHVLNVDKSYYDYYTSYSKLNHHDPFAEPTNLYSNIDGGLGVFCGYQTFSVTKKWSR